MKLLFLLLLLPLIVIIAVATHRPPARLINPIKEAGLVGQLNGYRQSKSLPTLSETSELDASANSKCLDMQANRYFSHDTPTRKWDSFLPYHYILGENLAQGLYGPTATLSAWEASPEHNANLLGDFNSVGLASCNGSEGHVYVAHFAQTKPF